MRSLTELPKDELKVAHDAAETLMSFKEYLPPGGLLLMLVSKFADDIRDVLQMAREGLPHRGRERKPLDELTSVELDTVSGAVAILLQDRFTRVMDDPALPALLREFESSLGRQKTDRDQIQASMAS
jgi:hypothetical protein